MNAKERFLYWKDNVPESDPLAAELKAMENDEAVIGERFYQEIAFGTAGLRGIYGAGTANMNVYTVGRATQGIADYILQSGEDISRGVALAYDCRYHSKEFAYLAAEIFAGNGIRSFIFPSMRPTPELSFAIRKTGALSGINMTASHNPKEYNGYKVYWDDGAQISGAVAEGMSEAIGKLDFFGAVKKEDFKKAEEEGMIVLLGEEMDRSYLDYILGMAQRDDDEIDFDVPLVYTPLHGAGAEPMRIIMKERGFDHVAYVAEQMIEDPEFSTVGYPNPEDPKGFEMAEKLGAQTGAEVLIATDPDADRMAIEVRDSDGTYRFLNGNQTGALLIAYMAESQSLRGTLPGKDVMVKSIVTGDLGKAICEKYGIRVVESLTGFKNICGRIPEMEKEGYTCFFAYEESIGCAPSPEVRDKDGLCAGMLIAEMAGFYRKKGKSLLDALDDIYREFGYYGEVHVSLVLKGIPGKERIARIMEHFRAAYGGVDRMEETPEGVTVIWDVPGGEGLLELGLVKTIDYIGGYRDIPASDVLKFIFNDGSWFAMRPSGTEPKLKFYFYSVRGNKQEAEERAQELHDAAMEEAEAVE
ncbi:MAG: phospho-sugar mutase [Lachnospiraceae bacterium]|nr:phospho-sugar mutase [Lachnospiraceae bacterium]